MTDEKRTFPVFLATSIMDWPWWIRPPQRRFEDEVSSVVSPPWIAEQDERKAFDIAFVFKEKSQKLRSWHFVDCWQCFSLLSCVISSFLWRSFHFHFLSSLSTSPFMIGVLLLLWARIGGFPWSLLLLHCRGSLVYGPLGIASFPVCGLSNHASIRFITASSRKVRYRFYLTWCWYFTILTPSVPLLPF